jgi:predicted DCC family thiol-disulfide oxidoreductase YuxK
MSPILVIVGFLLLISPAILLVLLIVIVRRFRDDVYAQLRRLRDDVNQKSDQEPGTKEQGTFIG